MKIGLVTEYYYPTLGGITEHIHNFYIHLKKIGHEPIIITSDAGHENEVDLKDVHKIYVGKSFPIYSNGSIARITLGFGLGRRIKEILKSEQFDILHIHSPFFPTLAVLGQKYSQTVTVGTFHTFFDSRLIFRLLKKQFKDYLGALHGKIAVSDLCIKSIDNYCKGEFKVIPNGVNTTQFSHQGNKMPEFDDGKLNILFLSRMEPRNGLEYLIHAFSLIRQHRNNCRLILAGDGPFRRYYQSLVKGHLKKDVVFLGKVKESRPDLYRTADIFCFPTTLASFGITLLEAMACGKAVVAFSLPAFEKIITSGENGLLCGEPSIHNLATALENLLQDHSSRENIGLKARKKAEMYSWSKITEDVVNYYKQVSKTG